MKAYSLGNNRRIGISLALMVAAIGIAEAPLFVIELFPGLKTHMSDKQKWQSVLEWSGLTISLALAVTFFGFNRLLWRIPWVRYWIDVPDLNGIWIGKLERTEYPSGEQEKDVPVILRIKQRFFDMSICLENMEVLTQSGYTESTAETIGLLGDREAGYTLDFTFTYSQGFGVNSLKLSSDGRSEKLSGEYVSSFPRKGKFSVTRLRKTQSMHLGTIKKLRSLDGEDYFGVLISDTANKPYHEKFSSLVSNARLTTLLNNRKKRDGNAHHMTVVSPPEYKKLKPRDVAKLEQKKIAFALTGFGRIARDEAETWFITATSQHVDFLRRQAGLPPKDLHVTLGFDPQDIHDHPKGESTWIASVTS